jgi:O-succinylbenzoic acid--CoA ligase
MTSPSAAEADLVAIDLAGRDAATAIRSCWDDGDAVIVLDSALPDAAKSAVLWQVRPTAVIGATGRRRLDGTPVAAGTAAVVMTSGTATDPKGVVLSRRAMQTMAEGYSTAIGANASDRWLAALPLSGVAGLAIVARSYVTGVPALIHDRYRADAVMRAAEQREATIVSVVPTALARLLDREAPLDRFRVVLVGGAPLPDPLRRRAVDAGVPIVTTYGMTETWGGFALDGIPIADTDVRVGTDGEIQVAGAVVMDGYRLDPVATSDALVDGWLRTGDVGTWDGVRVEVTGRATDRIISGGVSVSPAAVERVLVAHPAVADAAVVGAADPEWGERVVAYIVPVDPVNVPGLDALRDHVKSRLHPANAPREVHPVSQIPRNAAGKIVRRNLGAR